MAKKSSAQKSAQQAAPKNTNLQNLLDKGFSSLENENWEEADKFFEQALGEDEKEPLAYFGKLMTDMKYRTENEFTANLTEISSNENYKKAESLGDTALKDKLNEYSNYVVYNQAKQALDAANSVEGILEAKAVFAKVVDFLDAKAYMDQCGEIIYTYAYETVKQGYETLDNTDSYLALYKAMSDTLKNIADHRNSAVIAQKCDETLAVYDEKIQKIKSDFKEKKAELEHNLFAEKKKERDKINELKQQSSNISLELADAKNKFALSKLFSDKLSPEAQALKDKLDEINAEIERLTNEGAENEFKKEFVKIDIEKERALKKSYTDIMENYNILNMFEIAENRA